MRGQVRRACGSLIDVHDAKTQEMEQNQAVAVLIERMHDLANGELQGRIPDIFPVRFSELRRDYNAALDSLCTAMQIVTRTSDAIKSNAHEIQSASDDLSRRTEHQAASLEETAAAMDEITGAVREAADNARRACSIVDTARTEASESNDVVKSTIEAMTGIERTSSEISEIIGVIDGIAFQTNLLALNAGVEAARAGDAGRGFAVVASEVRALAQRSAEAAKDVKARITASSSQVERGVKLVGETGNALQRIVTRIGSISELVTVIVSRFEQQSVGLQQINTAIGEMDSVTQQNAAMVEEASASARNLASEADELSSQVMRFDTGASDALQHSSHAWAAQERDSGNQMPRSRAA